MLDFQNQTALEMHFADHFNTVLFTVLADFYLKENDLKRARKVCDIGLNYHPHNPDGWFIKGQIEQSEGNFSKAEIAYKKVLESGSVHLRALTELINVQNVLGRSAGTIRKLWETIAKLDPGNTAAEEILSPATAEPEIPDNSQKEKQNTALKETDFSPIEISPRLATFTMAAVYCNQGLYAQALAVLDILEKKGESLERIEQERIKIQKIMEQA